MNEAVATPAASSELSPRGFEIVRAAVNLARNEQIKTLKVLRSRLEAHYPGAHDDIEAALEAWRRHAWSSVRRQINQ